MSEGVGRLPRQARPSAPALPFGDGRLRRHAAAGDERAFAAIYRRYHQDLYRYCLALLRDREDAQDALQATMVKALRALPGETREIELKPWLFRIAHNESISLVRRRRTTAELDPEMVESGETPERRTVERERLRELVSDLDALPERQRGALVMRELSGLGFEQIGAALGASPAAAKQAVYEARVGLQHMAEGREMECGSIREAISAGDRRTVRGRRIRAHLRTCDGCRAFEAAIGERRSALAALAPPLAAPVAVATLPAALGAGGVGAGSGAAGSAAGIGSVLGAGAAVKAGIAVVATVAIAGGAAELSGVIDVAGSDRDASPPARTAPARDDTTDLPAAAEDQGSSGSSAGGRPANPGGQGSRGQGRDGAPGQRTAPGQSSNQGHSATAPGHTGAAGNSASAPGQTGTAGNSASAPGHAGTAGNSASAPGQTGATPGQSATAGASPQASSTGQAHSSASGSQAAVNGQFEGGATTTTAPGQTATAGNSAAAPGQNK